MPIANTTESQTKQQNSTLTNYTISDDQIAQSGTLYFIQEQSQQGEKQQHLLSPVLKTKVDIKVTGIIARTKIDSNL